VVDPVELKSGDSIVYGFNNRWTCAKRIEAFCEQCGKKHLGWIMQWRYQCQLCWDSDEYLWEHSIMLSDWKKKQRRIKRCQDQ